VSGPARVTVVIRGLLAEPTGDEDAPYRPVILKALVDKRAIDFCESAESARSKTLPPPLDRLEGPPLFAGSVDDGSEAQELRDRLGSAIDGYASKQGAKPKAVCIRELGILYVDEQPPAAQPRLQNKVALVTGAAGAIGFGVCRGLLEAGAHVAVTDLAGERLDDVVAELQAIAPGRVVGVPLDVTDEESVARGFGEVIATWGGVDIVVVNAGIALVSSLMEMDPEAFRQLERVNVEGALLTIAEAGRVLALQGIGGDIVVVSTKNVFAPGARFGAYSATKAACHQLARIASLELAEYGVRVNMVAPDAVFSEGRHKSGLWALVGPDRMRARGLDEKGLEEYYRSRNLLKARVTGRHVANAVLFFATRQTPTTGATIPIDGGLPDATPR
jgi:NAD(P)-dependent dehydrogenase (short-subunit alcohol dehydrogenase family)